MKIKLCRLNQRGDTLIEVIIATVIIGIVLTSAYTLSRQAFKLGQVARERSQATQLIQEQAEGLRALRDSAASWGAFRTQISALGNPFHVQRNPSGQWSAASGGNWDPSSINGELPNFYDISVSGSFQGQGQDQFKGTIQISWPRFGDGDAETSTLYYNLTDRNITIPGG